MKHSITLSMLAFIAVGCAHLQSGAVDTRLRTNLWTQAQEAFWAGEFGIAEGAFAALTRDYPRTLEGQESLFYLGALRLDPRNAEWDSERAEERLREYLGLIDTEGPRLYRYPEARTLYELARELNLPPDDRMAALQPGERTILVEERVIVPAQESRELQAEVVRLRQRLAEGEIRIQEQQEELERIRRTLIGPARP